MRSIIVLFGVVLFGTVMIFAGELEDFESDVDFLKESYPTVKKMKTDSQIVNEFIKRSSQASVRSYRIQQAVERLGIKKTSLSSTYKIMTRSMGLESIGVQQLRDSPADMAKAYNDLKNQILYLKEINYSYESNSFEPPTPEQDTYDALLRFEGLVTRSYRITQQKAASRITDERKKEYINLFEDMTKIAREIDRKLTVDRKKMPSGFDVGRHTDVFQEACRKLTEIRSRKNMTKKELQKLENSKEVKEAKTIVDFSARQLKNDIETLKNTHFNMRINKVTLSPVYQSTGQNRNSIAGNGTLPKTNRKPEEWNALYREKINQAFRSEEKIRGVSEGFYENYRNLLPALRQKELDRELANLIKSETPAPFARSMAVRKIHTKYQLNLPEPDEIARLLEK